MYLVSKAELYALLRTHRYCEDAWYSCPKAEDGCAASEAGDECNCGADRVNAIIDRIFDVGPFMGEDL